MFKFFNKMNECDCCTPDHPKEAEDYKAKVKDLEDRVKQLTDQINTIFHETADEEFAFDFKAVNVFSLERNWKDHRPCTIIGYTLSEPYTETDGNVQTKEVVREWYLYCSKEQHTKLVEQFRNAMKGE